MTSNHIPFLIAAYAIFVILMAWDFIAPRLRLKSIIREAKNRIAREQRRGQTS
jgi:heme exporter protein D